MADSKFWKQHRISETTRSWDRRVEGFRHHIAIDGSLQGVSEKDAAGGLPVVQLDYDREEEPWYAAWCTFLAEMEVQRTTKRAELWACTMALSELVGPSTIRTDRMGILDGLWRGEEGCIGPKEKDADWWIKLLELIECSQKELGFRCKACQGASRRVARRKRRRL